MNASTRSKVIAILQEGVTNELGAVIQYLWHHYQAEGIYSPKIKDTFEEFSVEEMEHLEKISERIVALGGEPATKLPPIKKGGDIKQMMQDDLDLELGAAKMYAEHIPQLAKLGDTTSRLMLEKILADEEKHIMEFEIMLSKIRKK
ncbi:MAG: ferritin-like domain-containing protein [Dehalococcoidia bacterium]|nr:ferritin-like domain-containing protein [Dehalococcoidia bacterium]